MGVKIDAVQMKATRKVKVRKLTKRADIESALVVSARNKAASDAIRKPLGLEPVPESTTVSGWRQKLAAFEAKEAAKPRKVSTPVDVIADIARRRAKVEADRKRLDRDVRALVAAGDVPVAKIASALGVSRQRVYQLAA